jgi:cytochrome b561
MPASTSVAAYSGTAKSLHWLIVLLVTMQFVTAFLLPHIGRNTPANDVINLHFSLGVVIMLVMTVRLLHRLMHPVALEARDAPPLERLLARIVHYVFYLILIVGPVLGWASASAHRLAVTLFGIVTLPPLAQKGAGWANLAGDIHSTAMWVLLWLIGAHVVAALYHHVVRHDATLKRMVP